MGHFHSIYVHSQQKKISAAIMPKRKRSAGRKESKGKVKLNPQLTEGRRGQSVTLNGVGSVKEVSSAFNFSCPDAFFRSFIAPFNEEEFFEGYWEKKPLFIPHRDSQIQCVAKGIFSREILETIDRETEVVFLRDVCASRYLEGVREDLNGKGRVKASQLRDLLAKQKATIQFHQPQRFQNILWKMMEQLETRFGCLFGANIYITPKGSQGLAPHYDDVEVFILQLEGKKNWRLYVPPQELPRSYSKDLTEEEIGAPTHTLCLEPGDLLYFPRGTVHQAAVSDACSHSTHITFSTYQQHTYADYLSHALPRMLGQAFESNVSFRSGLPVGSLCSHQDLGANTQSTLEGLVGSLAKEVTGAHEQALQDMRLSFITNRLPPYVDRCDDPFLDDVEEMVIHPKGVRLTQLRLKHPGHTCVVVSSPDSHALFLPEARDTEEDGDDHESDEEEEGGEENGGQGGDSEMFHVYHSLANDRKCHMMSTERSKPNGYVFPMRLLGLFKRVEDAKGEWVSVSPGDHKEDMNNEMLFGDLVEYKFGV